MADKAESALHMRVRVELVQLLAKRAELDVAIDKAYAMLEGIALAEAPSPVSAEQAEQAERSVN